MSPQCPACAQLPEPIPLARFEASFEERMWYSGAITVLGIFSGMAQPFCERHTKIFEHCMLMIARAAIHRDEAIAAAERPASTEKPS